MNRMAIAAASFDATAAWAEGGSREAALFQLARVLGALDLGGSPDERAALCRAAEFFCSTRDMLESP